jgi:hypothetical protein
MNVIAEGLILLMIVTQPNSFGSISTRNSLISPSIPLDIRISRTKTLEHLDKPPTPQVHKSPPPADPAKTMWAAHTLDELIKKYACVQNYAATALYLEKNNRYAMAAGLNACIDQLELEDAEIDPKDMALFEKLQVELSPEWLILQDQMESLESSSVIFPSGNL